MACNLRFLGGQGGHTPLVHRPGCRRRSLCVRRPGSHLWSASPLCPLCLHQRLLQLHHRHGARHPGGEDGRSTHQIRHSGLVASSSKPQQSWVLLNLWYRHFNTLHLEPNQSWAFKIKFYVVLIHLYFNIFSKEICWSHMCSSILYNYIYSDMIKNVKNIYLWPGYDSLNEDSLVWALGPVFPQLLQSGREHSGSEFSPPDGTWSNSSHPSYELHIYPVLPACSSPLEFPHWLLWGNFYNFVLASRHIFFHFVFVEHFYIFAV